MLRSGWLRNWLLPMGLLLFLAAGSGCSDDALKSPTAKKMANLANVYLDYVANKGSAPPDDDALKKHIKSTYASVLPDKGIDPNNGDVLFSSERDNQPFVVQYKLPITTLSANSPEVVAYEKTGKNGRKLVVQLSTKVQSVTDSQLEELKNSKTPAK